jgi:large subunit ribosomal protein L21
MYAIVDTGGKQVKTVPGQTVMVEKLDNAEEGATIKFDKVVLLVADDSSITCGAPTIAGATVTGKVVANGKGPKILVFKYRSKSNYRKHIGHRQPFTKVLIESIEAGK